MNGVDIESSQDRGRLQQHASGGSKRLVHCVRPRTGLRVNLKIKWVGLHLLLDMASGRLKCASSSTGHTPEVTSIYNYEVLVSS